MMKKWIIGFAAALVVSLSATAEAASDGVKASLFDAKIVVNNNPVQLNADNPLLNYNGRVYLPVRQISELTGSAVGYDGDNRTIYIDGTVFAPRGIPPVKSQAKDDTFTLMLFSAKAEYEEGEPIQVWGRVVMDKNEPVTVYHGGSLLQFILADSEGHEAYMFPSLSLETTTFAQNDEYAFVVPNSSVLFNLNRQGISDKVALETYLNEAKRPGTLPKGTYTIKAGANYRLEMKSNPESRRFLEASIQFTVK